MRLLEESYNCIGSTAPYHNIAIRIARYGVAVLGKCNACNILWFFSSFKHTHPFIECATLIQCPKGNMTFASCHNLISIQWMKFNGNYRVYGALRIRIDR